MPRKYYTWLIFLGFLLLLHLGTSTYSRAMDALLWPVRLGLIAGLSILLVWSRWRHRNDLFGDRSTSHDFADHFLISIRRWYYGEKHR